MGRGDGGRGGGFIGLFQCIFLYQHQANVFINSEISIRFLTSAAPKKEKCHQINELRQNKEASSSLLDAMPLPKLLQRRKTI
jgi:hypothetical protein